MVLPTDAGHDQPGSPHGDAGKDAEHADFLAVARIAESPPAGSGGRFAAVRSGSWSDPDTWEGGRVPDATDAFVHIAEGIVVTYDGENETRLAMVRVDGDLAFAADRDTLLVVDTLLVNTTGTLTIAKAPRAITFDALPNRTFGDAPFHGSLAGGPLNAPVVAATSTPSGRGYLIVSADGGVFAVGDVRSGSVKRVGGAIGEGAQVVAALHGFLADAAKPSL